MKLILPIYIVIYLFACMQTYTKAFTSTEDCIKDIIQQVKNKRNDLNTQYLLSNEQTSDSLMSICQYYVPHKIHKILKLVDDIPCDTIIPTTTELDENIYNSYVSLLKQLKIYEGGIIPNSFGRHIDHVVGFTNGVFDRNVDRLSGQCFHKDAKDIQD